MTIGELLHRNPPISSHDPAKESNLEPPPSGSSSLREERVDVVGELGDMDDATKADMAAWTGCVAGALTEAEFRSQLHPSGFEAIEIRPTQRVHQHASSAIVRGRKPARP